jgi:hypothetical protein
MSTVPKLTTGELVNVTIKGARVAGIDETQARIGLAVGTSDAASVPLNAPGVTVERVAPAEWPPQLGDIWVDRDLNQWATLADRDKAVLVTLRDIRTDWLAPDDVLAEVGPMALEYRRGWTPTPAAPADSDEPAGVDKRADQIAGVRALADLMERHPEIRISIHAQTWYDYDDRTGIFYDAATLDDVELTTRPASGDSDDVVVSGRYALSAGMELSLYSRQKSDVPPVELPERAAIEPPAPIATHYETSDWKGDGPGSCGVECACGTKFGGFNSLAEATVYLKAHIADAKTSEPDEASEVAQ